MTMDEDTKRHAQIYDGFVQFFKYGTIAVVISLVLMAIFLV
ncbi:MAG: aa3-type cytochrome c oxidase subunit IV [Alphaproteobacteria bacterium]|nr:aa3-type cytochrome c oxidase subunit IV [Alphaproteobacteria bacterium]MBU0799328.1 aa3-type cytochrome c oxidase subunit IV [Alphaproteobacteria bacterium]MBU0888158.1 aa3-type cytochrome c oxidase subunit IV [Alphaproteobacteria bacterium]MBU1811603.1 aa3-type cytochrome c oxidase subunit IV [Alphaproteobacteria bacterium]MBU2091263.1 aa3-type cytochrome c oxidase subunit IV [Alphaproteobacteria bacterium]